MLISIMLQIFLIVLNAFFAASEMALISINENKIKARADEGDKRAQLILKLKTEPNRFLATIQIGITLAGFLASAFASEKFAHTIVTFLVNIGITLSQSTLKTISMVVITLILSFITLVFGELVPKRAAMKNPDKIARLCAASINLLSKVAFPFVKLLTATTNGVCRIVGIPTDNDSEMITEEEIRLMINASEERGAIEEYEKEMINNVFEFNDSSVDDLMTHRSKVIAIPDNINTAELIKIVVEEKYSRYPIYHKDIDDIIGVIHIKDLLMLAQSDSKKTLKDIMRKPYFVPEGKLADDLLREMKSSKNHMAVVVDEYGLTAGIITMEDLIEEIVGRIYDEHDTVDFLMQKLEDNVYLVNAQLPIDDVNDLLILKLPNDEYDTLAGFIIGILGYIPADGEKPQTEWKNLMFFVEQVKNKTINLVKVIINDPETEQEKTEKQD